MMLLQILVVQKNLLNNMLNRIKNLKNTSIKRLNLINDLFDRSTSKSEAIEIDAEYLEILRIIQSLLIKEIAIAYIILWKRFKNSSESEETQIINSCSKDVMEIIDILKMIPLPQEIKEQYIQYLRNFTSLFIN